jgi:Na+:H+ antiporter, NhaA family
MAKPSKSGTLFPVPSVIRRFLQTETAGGILMIAAAALALIVANSPLRETYTSFVHMPLGPESLKEWVKDGLMVLFFLLVGLELKHEMTDGFLAKKPQIVLPLVAAISGMVVPALIFLGINFDMPENWAGWAVASATDIAFALCILLLLGRGLPPAVKIFLLAIAIFDDVGAILIIAFFYSSTLNALALFFALLGIGALYLLNKYSVGRVTPYILAGAYLCICLFHAGIHPTMGGVIVGLMMPMYGSKYDGYAPAEKCIEVLHPWVGFFILPLFAFTAAGIDFNGLNMDALLEPLPLGIILALFLGKQLGIFTATYAAVKAGWAQLPPKVTWLDIYGVSVLAGIGFTISLFIGVLAFPGYVQDQVKLGVLGGSLLSALWGGVVLALSRRINSR